MFRQEDNPLFSSPAKHVFITGGSRGIGKACVEYFAHLGYKVSFTFLTSRDEARIIVKEQQSLGHKVRAFQCDVCNEDQVKIAVKEAMEAGGEVDILVCNAGKSSFGLVQDFSFLEIKEVLDLHVSSLFYLTQAILPDMIRRQQGSIITISSIWGITGAACEVLYSTAKGAVISFTKALAKEVGPSKITVNCVAPGVIATEMNQKLDQMTLDSLIEETPLGRLGQPREVATLVGFLASEEASFITGQIISPNGGLVI